MSEAERSRATQSARILHTMRCGDRAPFLVVGDEFVLGSRPDIVDEDTLVGTLWMGRGHRVELLVIGPDRGLLFTLATWLMVWQPVFPELAPLQFAVTERTSTVAA